MVISPVKIKCSQLCISFLCLMVYKPSWVIHIYQPPRSGGIWELYKDAVYCFEQHPIKQKLYSHLPLISQTIQIRRARHTVGEEKTNQWTITYGLTSVGSPAKTYTHQHSADTEYSHLGDLWRLMTDRDGWWESRISIRSACHQDDLKSYT